MVEERIRFHDMPPENATQPTSQKREAVLDWIRTELLQTQWPGIKIDAKLLLPEYGNHVDHDALFNEPAGPVIPGPARLWRIRPGIYNADMAQIAEVAQLSQPFSTRGKPGIVDFDTLYFVDEPATDLLLRNAEKVVTLQSVQQRKGDVYDALQPGPVPDRNLRVRALNTQFQIVLRRAPSEDEIERFLELWNLNIATSGHPVGSRATLMAVLMQPEVLFRIELGAGDTDTLGRKRLSQQEIAQAVSYALRDKYDKTIWTAARHGDLATKTQVAAQVQRLLDAPDQENPRLLQFFREYFGYPRAVEVFKDAPSHGTHAAELLVSDLDYLIQYILEQDRDVLRRLLTTKKAFVNWRFDTELGKGRPVRSELGVEAVYGLPPDWKWSDQQPIMLPGDERSGVLTHPAWLVAWSGNFDNDPVRRGKWIRTRLLGGMVPEVPIGVDARIPEAEHLSLRERLDSVTTKPFCWRCHQKMNPLGLPFEQFTHYGYIRSREVGKPVDTSGMIDRTRDENLDGTEVKDPVAMLQILANSERVEQVFVRHAFRYYLGRNETLGDAATLQQAWNVYRKSHGSYKAMVKSLLTSESFLYRTI